MANIFSPSQALAQLIRIDRKVALPLVAGLGLFAVAAIIVTWGVDVPTMGLMGVYVLFLGFLLIVAAAAVKHPVLSQILGWFLTVVIISTVSCFFISAVFRTQGVIKPTYCLVRFWERCPDAEAAVVARNAPSIDASVAPVAVPASQARLTFDPRQYRVPISFAGLITRESVVSLNRQLAAEGWRVDGASGQRISAAQGTNEVRFSGEAERPAAETLAARITAAGITSGEVRAQRAADIAPGTIEVWISN